jgi:glycosyltransferase involved in cell wall biosynthesis
VPDRGGLFYRGGAPEALEERVVGGTVAGVRFAAALAGVMRREGREWEGVACHWLVPSAMVAAPLTRGPMLAIAHSGDVHVLARRGLLGTTIAALLARGARLVFVAPELFELARAAVPRVLRPRLDEASLVHPMGLELERFAAIARRRAGRARGEPARLLVVGRLVAVKGIDVLLGALGDVAAPVELAIAGDGPLRAELEARAGAVPPRHRVRFLGAVAPERRDELLAGADLLVAPSIVLPGGRTEGTPTAVLEAVAAAVPVIATDAGGLADLPAPWARRVPPGDAAALAAAISETLGAGDAQLRATAAARSAAVLDWGVVGRRLHLHWFGAA